MSWTIRTPKFRRTATASQEGKKQVDCPYTFKVSKKPAFTGTGLEGYGFGPLRQRDLDVFIVNSEKGHDTFVISKKITHTYYVLSGSGYFTIEGRRFDIQPEMLVEVPPKLEYSYSGKMTMLGLARPRWFRGNETHTRWNPVVTQREASSLPGREPWITRLAGIRIAGKSPVGAYLRVNRQLWRNLPAAVTSLRAFRSYGYLVHRAARIRGGRTQALNTYFLRNQPELELIRRLLQEKGRGESLRVAVLGCSIGPEAYSVTWTIRSARPDLRLHLTAVDISPLAISVARQGIYSATCIDDAGGPDVFGRMTAKQREEFFDWEGNTASVKPWIREGINWTVGDVGEPQIIDALGSQDLVTASNFLCHMVPAEAERCLRNISRLISSNGYLFVSGVDLEVRTRIARELGWEPIQDLLAEIHEGDPVLRVHWPWNYTGLEPLDTRKPDWRLRYAAAFRIALHGQTSSTPYSEELTANAVDSSR
jgi:mannose-6-phosphate isomerase-like protein (cupin superfamily)